MEEAVAGGRYRGPGEESLSPVPPVARFVAVEVAAEAETKRPVPAMHGGAIEVRLGRSRSLVVERGFDASEAAETISSAQAVEIAVRESP